MPHFTPEEEREARRQMLSEHLKRMASELLATRLRAQVLEVEMAAIEAMLEGEA